MLKPMLASLTDAPLTDPNLIYEPKYDGIRAIVDVEPGGREVRLWSRLGNEKTAQFPEIVAAFRKWARRRKEPLVLDGEIVALDDTGAPAGFQNLQGRIHLSGPGGGGATAFIAFDLLREGHVDYRGRPLVERRRELERVMGASGGSRDGLLRTSEFVRGDGRALYERALEHGWEGLIAKHADSKYESGKRTPDWRKLKIVQEQEFVVGGWTEPRHARSYFGALLLGVYDGPDLIYVGHTGTGFNQRELERVMALLKPLETPACPFAARPKSNERPHWTRPSLVAQIKFTEWTADGKLRHPVYLGLRDDKKPTDVHREEMMRRHGASATGSTGSSGSKGSRGSTSSKGSEGSKGSQELLDRLTELEQARHDGIVDLPGGDRLKVTNLHKVFWPKQKLTKGALMRYYVEVAPFLLPAVLDRPLVMKRFPNGIAAAPFYQHRASDAPPGVRVETVSVVETRPQLIGGSLTTLLYMTQLAAISQDPWFSRVSSPQLADYVALDLDPPAGVPFARVLDVARWIRDELESLGTPGVPKTSGSDGLHIYIPLPPRTPYDAGLLFCQIIATVVAQKHPQAATVERAVKARGRRVYIDYLQNIAGKTLATAYSARASEYAGVSTPLTWQEVDDGVDREAFTITTVPARLRQVGDLWAALRDAKGADLSRVTRYAAGHRR